MTGSRVALFDSLQSFEDPRLGIRERFLQPRIGGGLTVGILSTPVRDPESLGWVLCHSFGLEQIYLNPLEVPIARRLTAMGFPVLRFHCQGYGDSELPVSGVSLASHLDNTLDAVGVLREMCGVERVGLLGARFGAAVAALVADRIGAQGLALWDPVVRGRTFVNGLVRQDILTDMGHGPPARRDPREVLQRDGVVDLQGFPLRREVYDELAALDVAKEVVSFSGEACVVQIGRSQDPRPDARRLIHHLESLGAHCRFEFVSQGKGTRPFGGPRYLPLRDGTKVDTQGDLAAQLEQRTCDWAERLLRRERRTLPSSGGRR